jgi:hypothetical protein
VKLTLGTTVFGRPRIEVPTALYYQRLAAEADVAVELVAAVSEDWAAAVFQALGWRVIWAPNEPLGEKHNLMLMEAHKTKPDAFILVGSDDWLIAKSGNPFDAWAARADQPLFGPTDLYVVDLLERRACLWSNPPIPVGAGRMFRSDMLDAASWRLWPSDAEKGLDAAMSKKLTHCWASGSRVNGIAAIDFKTDRNIWGYDAFARRSVACDIHEALAWLPPWALDLLAQPIPSL